MISFPFEGILKTVQTLTAPDKKTVDVPVTDRGYDSGTLQQIYDSIYTDGIAQQISNCLKVSPGTGMNVIVQPGVCKAGGAFGIEEDQRTLAVQGSHATLDRIDAVVARKDTNNTYRNIDLYVVQGNPASSPKAPEPTRNESVYEIVLAHIFVAKGTTSIASYRITDTRLDASLCGLLQGRPGTDTTSIFDQYQSALDEFLGLVQSAIDETTAGKLQKQIDEVIGKVYPVGSIYMSVSPTNPGELFGGTWESWGSGRVPVGFSSSDSDFNSSEKTGGSKTQNLSHNHTVNSHNHSIPAHSHSTPSHTHSIPSHKHLSPFGLDQRLYFGTADFGSTVSNVNGWNFTGGESNKTTPLRLSYTDSAGSGKTGSANGGNTGSGGNGNTGGSSPETNSKLGTTSVVQPYITCYMWKRTA